MSRGLSTSRGARITALMLIVLIAIVYFQGQYASTRTPSVQTGLSSYSKDTSVSVHELKSSRPKKVLTREEIESGKW